MSSRTTNSLIFAALLAASCSLFEPVPRRIPVHHYLGDARDLFVVRRVIVLPFFGREVDPSYLAALRESFVAELHRSQRFRVVPLETMTQEDIALYDSEKRGLIASKNLVELGAQYQVDGIVLVRVTSFRPWMPPSLGLYASLVSVHSGEPVWVVDETFDSSIEAVRLDALHYYRHELAKDESLHGPEMMQLSPRRYGAYVCARIVGTLE